MNDANNRQKFEEALERLTETSRSCRPEIWNDAWHAVLHLYDAARHMPPLRPANGMGYQIPEWAKEDDLGGRVPSDVRVALRAAYNQGVLDAAPKPLAPTLAALASVKRSLDESYAALEKALALYDAARQSAPPQTPAGRPPLGAGWADVERLRAYGQYAETVPEQTPAPQGGKA